MRQWCSIGVLALLTSGCILSTELCGHGFIEDDGRCVLEEAPPPYYGDARIDMTPIDGGLVDAAEPEPEPTEPEPPPLPEPDPPFDPWADRALVLVVDRTDRDASRRTPTSPGYDLDAVLMLDESGEISGIGLRWESAQVNDPFGRNLSRNPDSAVGEPDASGLRDPGRYTSLGADGGYVYLRLELFEPVRRGMTLEVFEMGDDRDDEVAEVYLCFDGSLDLSLCRSAGEVLGTGTLPLGD